MKYSCLLIVFQSYLISFFFSMSVNAALVDNGGGLIYDEDLDITWTANANINGQMTWSEANAWATGLSLGGVSGWRLPITTESDPSCTGDVVSGLYNCTGSEMGHLFYSELGGTAGDSILNSGDADLSLFSNIQGPGHYWSSTESTADTNNAWIFRFANGGQLTRPKTNDFRFAWAVHDGNISPVPAPVAFWLFGSGLMALIGIARHKKMAYLSTT